MKGTVLSLCDLTGNFTEPWREAGYDVVLVDPQHGFNSFKDGVTKWAGTVASSIPTIRDIDDLVFVAAFPPCTDMAVSGSRWFAKKYKKDTLFQAKAVMVAEQCRTIGRLSGVAWFVENPVSILSSVFGKPDHIFNPFDYSAIDPGDNYTKKTCLWTGGGFQMPVPQCDLSLSPPDDRIHKAPPGPDRANFRSATPMGFARAVFEANTYAVIKEPEDV